MLLHVQGKYTIHPMSSQVKSIELLTPHGAVMFHVWALGCVTVDEILQRVKSPARTVYRVLAELAHAGILYRVTINGSWYYSIHKDWVESNNDIAAMMEAVDEARSRGVQPTVKQL